jgi:hypothetical protein
MKRTREILFGVGCLALGGAAVAVFVLMYWQPLQMRRRAMSLPVVALNLTPEDLGLPIPGAQVCADVSTTASSESLQRIIEDMRSGVRQQPSDLCAGNRYRAAIKYLALHQGRFAIATGNLPPPLATIATIADSNVTENEADQDRRKVDNRPDDVEPASLFRELVSYPHSNSPETQLQLGLSYVDFMLREGGRETKARLSSHSIEALTAAIDQKPYFVAARYARGLNYLYWPAIAGRLPLAVTDLKTCVALTKQLPWHPRAQIFAEAYVALGDAYVKLSEMAISFGHRRDLIAIAKYWWREGLIEYPDNGEMQSRLNLASEDLVAYVESARAIETYINTDLNLLWTVTEDKRESHLSQP